MLINAFECFQELVIEAARRCRVEQQEQGWAVYIDGELYTWCITERKAYDLGLALIESGV